VLDLLALHYPGLRAAPRRYTPGYCSISGAQKNKKYAALGEAPALARSRLAAARGNP